MIVKLRRIEIISKKIARKKSLIWKDRFMRCIAKISRMALGTFPIKIISMDLWTQTRYLNLRKNLSRILREMSNFWIRELMINWWSTQMIQLLASNNSIQFMLNKMEISMLTISIRKEKRLQSILCLMRMLIQIRQRRSFLQ
jgi:hypothetical protein